ncbi:MAG: transcription elongation factor GreA [Alphaproteobacteria bacterium]
MERVPMTAGGNQRLDEELKRLKTVDRPQVIQAIAEAREHGDLSENAEYHAAKEQQGHIEARIQELESKLSRAQIIDITTLKGTNVKFGATVTVVDEDTDEEQTFQIVGEDEAEPKDGLISVGSPIARALIGKNVGDSAEVTTPGGTRSYEVLKVQYI